MLFNFQQFQLNKGAHDIDQSWFAAFPVPECSHHAIDHHAGEFLGVGVEESVLPHQIEDRVQIMLEQY